MHLRPIHLLWALPLHLIYSLSKHKILVWKQFLLEFWSHSSIVFLFPVLLRNPNHSYHSFFFKFLYYRKCYISMRENNIMNPHIPITGLPHYQLIADLVSSTTHPTLPIQLPVILNQNSDIIPLHLWIFSIYLYKINIFLILCMSFVLFPLKVFRKFLFFPEFWNFTMIRPLCLFLWALLPVSSCSPVPRNVLKLFHW